MLHSQPAS